MSVPQQLDLTELRGVWEARRVAMQRILSRFDPRGMRRPARDVVEREWLVRHGQAWFIEDEACAGAASAYYQRRYGG